MTRSGNQPSPVQFSASFPSFADSIFQQIVQSQLKKNPRSAALSQEELQQVLERLVKVSFSSPSLVPAFTQALFDLGQQLLEAIVRAI